MAQKNSGLLLDKYIINAAQVVTSEMMSFEDIRSGIEQLNDALILGKADVSWLVHDQHSCLFPTIELQLNFEGNIRCTRHGGFGICAEAPGHHTLQFDNEAVVSVGCNSLLRVVESDFAAAFGKEEIVGGELKWREPCARALIKMVIC